jgi:hypothetical protein
VATSATSRQVLLEQAGVFGELAAQSVPCWRGVGFEEETAKHCERLWRAAVSLEA